MSYAVRPCASFAKQARGSVGSVGARSPPALPPPPRAAPPPRVNAVGSRVANESTGFGNGTQSASISQTITTTPGVMYEIQFVCSGFSLSHPFSTFGLLQFGSSSTIFEGFDDIGGKSVQDIFMAATGVTTAITISFTADPALLFLDSRIQGLSFGNVVGVTPAPDTAPTFCLLGLTLGLMLTAKTIVARSKLKNQSCSATNPVHCRHLSR